MNDDHVTPCLPEPAAAAAPVIKRKSVGKNRAHDDVAASLRQAYDAALAEDVPSALTDLLQQLR